MEKYEITSNQIVWMNTTRHYIPESSDLLIAYSARVEIPDGATIFSDKGNAFFRDGESVLSKYFGVKTTTYHPLFTIISPPMTTTSMTWQKQNGVLSQPKIDVEKRMA